MSTTSVRSIILEDKTTEALRKAGKENNRSFSQECAYRLEQSLKAKALTVEDGVNYKGKDSGIEG